MSIKLTKKSVVATHEATIQLLAGHGARLLSCVDEYAHTEGVYGVDSHVYSVDGVAIARGDRPFGKRVSCELVDKYEAMAKEAVDAGYSHDSFTRYDILSKFIEEGVLHMPKGNDVSGCIKNYWMRRFFFFGLYRKLPTITIKSYIIKTWS